MEAGTIIIGLLCQALGTILVMLTAAILLILISIFLLRKLTRYRKIKAILKAFEKANPNIECKWSKDSVARANYRRFKRERADAGGRVLDKYDELSITPDFIRGDRAFDESESVKRELILDTLRTIDSNQIAMFSLYHHMYTAPPTNRNELEAAIRLASKRMIMNPPIATTTGPQFKPNDAQAKILFNLGNPTIGLDDLKKELDIDD